MFLAPIPCMIWLSLLLLSLNLCSCQKDNGSSPAEIELNLELPSTLTGNATRYANFLKRASYLEIKFKSEEGVAKEYHFPVDKWDQIYLSDLNFPQGEGDSLSIRVYVWDRTHTGELRSYAVLRGQKTVRADELSGEAKTTVSIKLYLQVSPRQYD